MAPRTVSTQNFGQARNKFEKAGIPLKCLVPIAPPGARIAEKNTSLRPDTLGKAPGRYRPASKEWSGLTGETLHKGVSPEDIERSATWPTANVGLLGRAYPAIDSDAETEAAARLVRRVLDAEFGSYGYAERIRGTNHRRLFAFRARRVNDPVKTRHVEWALPDQETPNKLDVIGRGGQFLIAGTHPSGDAYRWAPDADLSDAECHDDLTLIEDEDVTRFLEALEAEVQRLGGTWRGRSSVSVNDLRDPSTLDPTYSNDVIFAALKGINNDEATFPHRDDLVSFLAAVRAGAGRNSDDPDFIDEIREWATAHGWADDDYFDKIWDSLEYTRATPDTLDRYFRQHGYQGHVADRFDDEASAVSAQIKAHKGTAKEARKGVLAQVAGRYIFRNINLEDSNSKIVMRDVWNPEIEFPALDWFVGETTDRSAILRDVNAEYGESKKAFWNFMAALSKQHPECWYSGMTKDPFHGYGELVRDELSEHGPRFEMNRWYLSPTIKAAAHGDKNQAQSARDVATWLEFVRRLFGGGEIAEYELDTLAYMVQTRGRPPAMLYLVGEPGVGKSTHTQMMSRMFNGTRPTQMGQIDGTKLINESSRRFAFADIEGCRIVSIKEMPKGKSNARELAQVTSILKQVVDPGAEGDWVTIEQKGKDTFNQRNYARYVVTSNYGDSLHIEAGDRRIFMVVSAITMDNRPPDAYYEELNAIMEDPERFAAIYRYLKGRPLDRFNPRKAPPASSAKREKQMASITNPMQRHILGALEWLRASGRVAFDRRELLELATECAKGEYAQTGDDNRIDYVAETSKHAPDTKIIGALRCLNPLVLRPAREYRTGAKRPPAIYFLNGNESRLRDLENLPRNHMLDFLDDQIDQGVTSEHPWEIFRA